MKKMNENQKNRTEKAMAEMIKIKKLRKRSAPKRSRLSKFKFEIIMFREEGYSYEDIRLWLRREKRLVITSRAINQFYENHCKDNQ